MPEPIRIEIDWRVSPSDPFGPVVPTLTAMPDHPKCFGMHEAVLVPSSRFTLFPYAIATQMGIVATEKDPVSDPLFLGFDLWKLEEAIPVKVFGESLQTSLRTYLHAAVDSTQRLSSIVLGERFFHQGRLNFEPDKPRGSWIEQFRFFNYDE